MKNLGFYLTLAFVLGVCANQALAQERATGEKGTTRELLPKIRLFVDNLIEHGRDRYGPKHTPLFVGQLDGGSKSVPPADTKLYITGKWTGTSGPTTSNLQYDNGLLRLLYGLTRITGDKKYALAADEYLKFYLANLPDTKGNFPWGDHKGYEVVKDKLIANGADELKITYPAWEAMYRINPEATRKQIEALKLHIIDESRSYAFNRHYPPGKVPHSMNSSGGAYIAAWSFLYTRTHDKRHLEWANKMADYLWSVRNPETGLLAAHPADPLFDCTSLNDRPKRTEYMGPWTWYACNLLRASQLLGPREGAKFREQALAYIRAFTSRAQVLPTGAFYATFDLATGKPICPRLESAWTIDWEKNPNYRGSDGGTVGLLVPVSLAFAYKVTGEADLRKMFDSTTDISTSAASRRDEGHALI